MLEANQGRNCYKKKKNRLNYCLLVLYKIDLYLLKKEIRKIAKMKQCTKCKKWKDESEFGKDGKSKDGLRYWCKKCNSRHYRERCEREGREPKRYCKYEERHRIVGGVKEKRCSKCKKWKAESEFYKKRRHKDGLAVWCKECADKATNKSRRKRMAAKRTNIQSAHFH